MKHRVLYTLFRAYVRLMLRVSLRRFEIAGLENVPRDRPVLLIGNHLNGPLDPMLLLAALDRRVLFTARAALLRSPVLRLVLWILDAALFVRRGDLPPEAASACNAAALRRCDRELAAGGAVMIFPEGKSHSEPRLLPFKTGAARLALQRRAAPESTAPPAAPLVVLPFAVSFRDKARFRTDARLEIGPPVDVDACLAAAGAEDPAHALTRAFAAAVSRAFETISWPPAPPPTVRHLARDVLRSIDSLLVGLPMFLFGAVNHLPLQTVIAAATRVLSKDLDHWAPTRFYAALVLAPFFYALQAAAVARAFGPAWSVLYLALLPLSGLYALAYADRLRDLAALGLSLTAPASDLPPTTLRTGTARPLASLSRQGH